MDSVHIKVETVQTTVDSVETKVDSVHAKVESVDKVVKGKCDYFVVTDRRTKGYTHKQGRP